MVNVLESTMEVIVSSGIGSHTPYFYLDSASDCCFVCGDDKSDGSWIFRISTQGIFWGLNKKPLCLRARF
jgi:hypothetical protein